jgi:hypothetical protein
VSWDVLPGSVCDVVNIKIKNIRTVSTQSASRSFFFAKLLNPVQHFLLNTLKIQEAPC